MKLTRWILTAWMVAALGLTGCGKRGLDAAALEKSFASADAGLKAPVEKALESIKAGDYQKALAELTPLLTNDKLTEAQNKALNDAVTALQKMAQEQAKKLGGDLKKAVGQ
jgi:hypothetical protein